MFTLSKPSQESIAAFISRQKQQPLAYAEVGSSRHDAPNGYTVDHNRIRLGEGAAAFERAKDAIRQWKMFDLSWLQLCWPNTPIEVGQTVAVLVSPFGFWSLNPCRIVYVVDQDSKAKKFGFAYGTLAEHQEIGEERFMVEYHPADESVWYEIYAFSRPRLLPRVAYPYARSLQKRFAKDSMASMQRFVQSG